MTAYEIKWDYDLEEVFETAMEMEDAAFASTFGINKSEKNVEDIVCSKLLHCPGLEDEIMGVPTTVEIPEEVTAEANEYDDEYDDAITEWLSDTYGWCIRGYRLSTDK